MSYTQPPDHYADYQWNQEHPGSNSGLYFLVLLYPTVESLTAPLAECVGTVTCTFEQQRTSMCLMAIKCTITNLLHPSVILCWLTSTPHLLPGTGGYMHTINNEIYRKWPKLERGVNNDNLSINTESSGNDNYVMTGGGIDLQEVKEVNLIIHRPNRSRSYNKWGLHNSILTSHSRVLHSRSSSPRLGSVTQKDDSAKKFLALYTRRNKDGHIVTFEVWYTTRLRYIYDFYIVGICTR